MSFNALLNKTYTLYTCSNAVDSIGAQIESYTSVGKFPCRLDNYTGGEMPLPERIKTRVSAVMFCSVHSSLTETSRVAVDSVNYNVLLVRDAGGKQHHYEVALERMDSANY